MTLNTIINFLRFIDLLLHKSSMVIRYLFYWSCFYSYFIDHTTHKTTWEDPRLKRPEAIPLTQFKVKSTMIWNSIWLMVIDLNLNKKWPIESKLELGINNQQLIRAHCTKWCWLIGVKCNSESRIICEISKLFTRFQNHQGPVVQRLI